MPTFFRVSSSGKEPPESIICFSSILICFLRASIFSSDFSKSLFNSGTVYSLLTLGAFLMFLARAPNLSVLSVSASLNGWGEQVMIRSVFELPPSDSDSILVSFDSLYGICYTFLSVRATMTLPSVVKLLLIFLASSKTCPYAPVFDIFSEPAKSTRNSLPVLHEPSSLFCIVIVSTNIAWERELTSFILVAVTALLEFPWFINA